jgi:hypothetical protein
MMNLSHPLSDPGLASPDAPDWLCGHEECDMEPCLYADCEHPGAERDRGVDYCTKCGAHVVWQENGGRPGWFAL